MSLYDNAALVCIPSGYKAGTLYSVKPNTAVGDFTVVRAGDTATRINSDLEIEGVDANIPRLNYFTASGCPQLLAEPERKNELGYSESFDHVSGYWTLLGATLTSGQASPSADYPLGAYKLVESSGVDEIHQITAGATITQAADMSISIIAKKGERDYIAMGIRYNDTNGSYAQFNLSNGTVQNTNAIYTVGVFSVTNAKITELADGYYLCSATFNSGRAGCAMGYAMSDAAWTTGNLDTYTYTGDGTSGIYIYGAQLEEGSYPTSYIRSEAGGTVTRSADAVTGGGDATTFASVNSSGVLYFEGAWLEAGGKISLTDGSSSNRCTLQYQSGTNIRVLNSNIGVVDTDITVSPLNNHKYAVRYSVSGLDLFVDGTKYVLSVADCSLSLLDVLNLTDGAGTSNNIYGNTRQVAVYNYLTDEQMISLTTP